MKHLILIILVVVCLNPVGGCVSSQKAKRDKQDAAERRDAENRYNWSVTTMAVGEQEAKNIDDRIKQMMGDPVPAAPEGWVAKRSMDVARLNDVTKSMVTIHGSFKHGNEEIDKLRTSNVALGEQRNRAEKERDDEKAKHKQDLIDQKKELTSERNRRLDHLVFLGLIGLGVSVGLFSIGGAIAKSAAIGMAVMTVGAVAVQAIQRPLENGVKWAVYGLVVIGLVYVVYRLFIEKRVVNKEMYQTSQVFKRFIPSRELPKALEIVDTEIQSDHTKHAVEDARSTIKEDEKDNPLALGNEAGIIPPPNPED